jgi:hypothetical protein
MYDPAYNPAVSGPKTAPVATIINRDGTNGPTYVLPLRQGDHPTTRTLFTCFSYMSGAYGGIVPHQVNGNALAATVNAPGPYRFIALMAGMSMAYTDGSARFVPPGDMGAVADGSWYFYDTKANN